MRSLRHNQRTRIRATDLADMGFCEQKCLMKARHGDVETPEAKAARTRGHAEHQRFDHQVRVAHNTGLRGQRDRRCFIASAVYGSNDPRTEALRRFRDEHLIPSTCGRIFVKLYYTLSPLIAALCEKSPLLRTIMKNILDGLRRQFGLTAAPEQNANASGKKPSANSLHRPHKTEVKPICRRVNIESSHLAALINEGYAVSMVLKDMGDVEGDVDKGLDRDSAVELWVRFEHAIWNLQRKQEELLKIINAEVKKHGLEDDADPMSALVNKCSAQSRAVWAVGMYRGFTSAFAAYRLAAWQQKKVRIEMVVWAWANITLCSQRVNEAAQKELVAEGLKAHRHVEVRQFWASPYNGGYCQAEIAYS